jgi:HlyD family secretion protein
MEVRMETANARSEQYGLLLGRVHTISPYPTSEQRILTLLQNEALARSLSAEGPVMEAEVTLVPDPATPSGYRWTSPQGFSKPISSGLLCKATLLVSEKTPLSFAFPHKAGTP